MLDHDTYPAASLPAVLSWSLRRLTGSPAHRRAAHGVRAAGHRPGPDTTLPAATALTGLPGGRDRKVLSALEEASLPERRPHGRREPADLRRSRGHLQGVAVTSSGCGPATAARAPNTGCMYSPSSRTVVWPTCSWWSVSG